MAAVSDNFRDEVEEELALCLSSVVEELRDEDEEEEERGDEEEDEMETHRGASSFLVETLLEIDQGMELEDMLRAVTFTQVGEAMKEVAETFYPEWDRFKERSTTSTLAVITELQSMLPVVPRAGDYGMAVMNESKEWHECKVVSFSADDDCAKVSFVGFGGEHTVKREALRLDEEIAGASSSSSSAAPCEMCKRELKLTRHHLIPRTTHSRLMKKDPEQYPRERLNEVAL